MGQNQSIKRINFEDMQIIIKNPEIYLLINTLPSNEQNCIIINTINIDQEEILINKFIKENKSIKIIIYGKNCNDSSVEKKYYQLVTIGFYNVYVYSGGMFEWLMLQDIYGFEMFTTNKKELDFLKYKPNQILNISLLEN
jgi:rhodanese-related sulfurtransferase